MFPKSLLVVCLLAFSTAAICPAAPLILNGNFVSDDDVALIVVNIPVFSLVTIQTTSFADGSKGFEPVLTLYDAGGNLLQVDQGGTVPGGCGARAIDGFSGACLDAYIQSNLLPGNYTIALTQWDNIPSGPTLADGFPHAGEGNFTGPNFLGSPGSFILYDGSQRNNNWTLQVVGAAVPEPGTFGLALSSILVLLASRKLARRTRAS